MPDIVPVLTLFGLAALRIMPSANRIMTASNNLRYYESSVHEVANELRLVERYIKRIPHGAAPPRARKREPLTREQCAALLERSRSQPKPAPEDDLAVEQAVREVRARRR